MKIALSMTFLAYIALLIGCPVFQDGNLSTNSESLNPSSSPVLTVEGVGEADETLKKVKQGNKKIFVGYIARNYDGAYQEYPFWMSLWQNGENLGGEYFYLKSRDKQKLKLSGKITKDGKFSLVETDPSGAKTGEFRGEWRTEEYKSVISGDWINPKSRNKLRFYASEQMIFFKTDAEVRPFMRSEENKQKRYRVDVQYPEIYGVRNAQIFNNLVKGLAEQMASDFRTDAEESWEALKADRNMMESHSFIDLKYNITYADENVLSLFLSESRYFAGAAHPNHGTSTINFDMEKGRTFALRDLFNSPDYLDVISQYCIKKLKAKFQEEYGDAEILWEEGAKPEEENYRNWAITKNGLLIIFNPYEVAPYAAGTQEVLITYDKLKSILKKDGPIKFIVSQ
ncbi:MAG: DUF3298 domain-containing protein [Acidobacteria bacterium]|jgi:hypothetical protein|nr:MAG: DUF3298 domain-containing protein [Acidobacteriota bacterium]GIU81679.1 MAG: hypothetical protein KatS3mg006_0743 [Pyrinomonadaceae bacterium]